MKNEKIKPVEPEVIPDIHDDEEDDFCLRCDVHLRMTAFQMAMDVPGSGDEGGRGGIVELISIAKSIYNYLLDIEEE